MQNNLVWSFRRTVEAFKTCMYYYDFEMCNLNEDDFENFGLVLWYLFFKKNLVLLLRSFDCQFNIRVLFTKSYAQI